MAIEPTSIQRDQMLSRGKTKLTLAQFLVMKDPELIEQYLLETGRATVAEDGSRDHQLKVDQVLTGGEMLYQYLTVDSFPSSQTLLMAHENTRDIRQTAVKEIYSLYLKLDPWKHRLVKALGFLAPILARWLDTSTGKDLKGYENRALPDIEPDPEKVKVLRNSPSEDSFYMMNLNQFTPPLRRGMGGKSSYSQYSIRILPYLLSVGGYPDIYGEVLGNYIGDQKSQLSKSWHYFALVYYPSRSHFLRLMTNTPRNAAIYRRAGLKRVVLMPCSRYKQT